MAVLLKGNKVPPNMQKQMLDKLEGVHQAYLWISNNEQELQRSYLNQYIAVKNNQVVFSSPDFEALLKVMIASRQDVDTFAVKRITKEATCLLL